MIDRLKLTCGLFVNILFVYLDVNLSSNLFMKQITKLLITIGVDLKMKPYSTMKYISNHIFTVFKKLTQLTFSESSYQTMVGLSFAYPSINFCSSTLLVLNVRIDSFPVCLYILDGRFNQLHTLIMKTANIFPSEKIENHGDIPSLKCFSLSCFETICCYDEVVLPLLYRMSNLETLNLSLSISVKQAFIGGYNLKNKIVNRMPRVNKFTFDIHSIMRIQNDIIIPINEDIRNTFNDFQYTQLICYMDHFTDRKECRGHVYTYPSKMSYYQYISNQFPGGYYPHVRLVSLYDEYPFEHEFFLRIVQSFPFMERLVLSNIEPQQHKQSHKSTNDDCHLSIAEYSHLIELDLERATDDYVEEFLSDRNYVEEFLSDRKTCFRKNIRLCVMTETLLRVTKHFTRDDTRMNCTKVGNLLLWSEWRSSKYFQEYFPSLKDSDDCICPFFY
ncbi:unnamed protein product [Rotaria magnacalcarata]|uniref:Uncharacterized protein n=1 Tax=Rotaria magnacalcarata TaxID=392030 RepID=A0A816RET8_9BILA|nr:unnamed protein product [Rotaria magnacalcarata]CAF4167299.1 unnamed protein product [Rotaria magnacalcarata]